MKLFVEAQPLRMMGSDASRYGLVRLHFSEPPKDIDISYQDVGQELLIERHPDTTKVWYDLPEAAYWDLYLQKDTLLNDTVKVKDRNRQEFLEKARLALAGASKNPVLANPSKPIQLEFNHPLIQLDTSLMKLYEDTLRTLVQPNYSLDTNGQRRLILEYPWKEGLPYELELMPGALTGLFGLQNDTLIKPLQIERLKSFGNILLQVDSLSADSAYYMELLDKNDLVVFAFSVRGDTSFQRQFRLLPAGKYALRIVDDWNGNGAWDTGNYDLMRQPEPIYRYELDQLRANWDLETTVNYIKLREEALKPPPIVPQQGSGELPPGRQPPSSRPQGGG